VRSIADGLKERLRLMTFDDLLVRFHQALSGPGGSGLAATLRKRFKVAMIDEFQDTDPVQYSIFRKIYPRPSHDRLILIGDPKQAIYGFRGADIFTYLKARRAVSGDRRFGLGVNWRSSPGLVEAVNSLFSASYAPFVYQEIPYHQVRPCDPALPRLNDPDLFGDMVVWTPAPFLPRNRNGEIDKGVARRFLAKGCAAEIARLLKGGREGRIFLEGGGDGGDSPLAAGDIAVLVKDQYQAQDVKKALEEVGISSVFYAKESVFATKEAQELLLVLRGVAMPREIKAVSTALATEAVGWDAAAIASLEHDEMAWDRISSLFEELHRLWLQRGFLVMFRVMLHRLGISGRLLSLPQGERRLTNWSQLGELIHQAGMEGVGGIEGQLAWLSRQMASPDSSDEGQQLRLESDRELVTIMTIHRSKGLEFPVVFLPFAWDLGSGGSRNKELRYYDAQRECYVVDVSNSGEGASIFREQCLAEELRLLYVALTRAKVRCYLSWGGFKGAVGSGLGYLLGAEKGEDDRRLVERLQERFRSCRSIAVVPMPKAGEADGAATETATPLYSVRSVERQIIQTLGVESFSYLTAGGEEEGKFLDLAFDEDVPPARPGVMDVFSFPRGPAAGNCIHAVLENTDFTSLNEGLLLENCRRWLAAYGLDVRWDQVLVRMVRNVLTTELLPGLSLDRIPNDEKVSEMEFAWSFGTGGEGAPAGVAPLLSRYHAGMMRGFIDLLFHHDGRYFIVDYKSNHLGDTLEEYQGERLEAAMREHGYHLQAEIYALAVHRFLSRGLEGYRFMDHFGGVFYLFVRGMEPSLGRSSGVYFIPPEQIASRIGVEQG